MIIELTENYLPNKFLFREKQYLALESTFINFEKFGFGGNKLNIGLTGTGKTALTSKIISERNNSLFVSAQTENTTNKLLKSLTGITTKKDSSELCSILIKQLKQNKKLIIIDEIDKSSNVKEVGNYLNMIYRATQTPIIIISNQWNILTLFADDAQKTLAFERIEFLPYDACQLFEILNSRFDVIKTNYPHLNLNDIEESLHFIAFRVLNVFNGSVRMLLDIALTCLINNNFSKGFIEEIIQKKNNDEWANSIANLGKTEKDFLQTLLEKTEDNEKEYVLFSEMSKKMGFSEARISQVAKILFIAGLINVKSIPSPSGKVGNRPKVCSFASPIIKQSVIKLLKPWETE